MMDNHCQREIKQRPEESLGRELWYYAIVIAKYD